MHSFLASSSFLFVLGTALLLPGFLILRKLFRRESFLSLETLLFSFAVSVGLIDFLMIILERLDVHLEKMSLLLGGITSIVLVTLTRRIFRHLRLTDDGNDKLPEKSFPFSRHGQMLFVVLIALTILIKTTYMADAVLPTATDLGHHMYWSKLIAETGQLPLYAKQEIVTDADGTYRLTNPEPIADFIIGEHLPFAAIAILSGADFFSAFPVMLLFFVNILGLLALVVLALRFASEMQKWYPSSDIFTPQNIALTTLFFFGPLYTLASPQEKFVSGGVVGNTFGNLFLPLIILAYYRAFRERRSDFLGLGFFLTFTLAYTHHLSTLILLFVLSGTIITYLLFRYRALFEILRSWLCILLRPAPLFVALAATLFFFLVAMPTYIETHAVGTALGTPTKTTRTGLSFYQITFSSGEARVALGLAGIVLIALLTKLRRSYAGAFLLGWSIILLVMTLEPGWLLIDIPSNRIGTYLSFPLGILASFVFIGLIALLYEQRQTTRVSALLGILTIFGIFVFSAGSGSFDNNQTLLPHSKSLAALETFSASRYLADHTSASDSILKDHNYVSADAWMKLFFLRDYAYPLSRGFFKRYEDNPHREQCTLLMISVPNTARGEKCYFDLGVDFIVVNPHFDTAQFEKSDSFSKVYSSEMISIYKRK